MGRIPCYVIVYYNFDVIRQTLEFLLRFEHQMAFTVVENASEFTNSTIQPYLLDLLRREKIGAYIVFEQNISSNALEVVFDSGRVDPLAAEYIMLTDGDLVVRGHDHWLNEQITILDRHPEVFGCSIGLDLANLPVATFPDAPTWIPAPRAVTKEYVETDTGVHLLLMRSREFVGFLQYRRRHRLAFTDQNMQAYARTVLGKKWVTPRFVQASHLTWDLYADPNHPYTRMKAAQSFGQTWYHHTYCGFRLYAPGSTTTYFPFRKALYNQWVRPAAHIAQQAIRRLGHVFRK